MNRYQVNELLRRVRSGDEGAFESLYEGTSKGVYAYIYSFVHNSAATEDLLQETFIRVKQKIDMYHDMSGGMAWIMQIAKRLSINYIRDMRETPVDFTESPELAGTYHLDEGLENTEVYRLIMTELSEDEGCIVLLHALSGLKHREVAEIVGKPLGTVLWLYNKAVKRLKELLDEAR